jgi:NAD(P)H-hydrate repair Nnr-like enzyme with NAD(P)H-hydrate dehydratase domain
VQEAILYPPGGLLKVDPDIHQDHSTQAAAGHHHLTTAAPAVVLSPGAILREDHQEVLHIAVEVVPHQVLPVVVAADLHPEDHPRAGEDKIYFLIL